MIEELADLILKQLKVDSMKHLMFLLVAVLASVVPLHAADTDRRLATVKTAYVFPADDLKDDKPVAACFAEHLTKNTPLEAADKDSADVLLSVKASIAGTMGRAMGGLGAVTLIASLRDGTVLWKGFTSVSTQEPGLRAAAAGEVACQLADEIADKLRTAMRKVRDKK